MTKSYEGSGAATRRARLDWFKFWPGDFLGSFDVRAMTLEAKGAYIVLLAEAWQNGGWLPNNHRLLACLAGVDAERWAAIWAGPLEACWVVDGERLLNPRLSQERADAERKVEQNRASAARGGRAPRANAKANAPANAKASAEAVALANAEASSREERERESDSPPNPPSGGDPFGEVGEEEAPPPRRRDRTWAWRQLLATEYKALTMPPWSEPMEEWVQYLRERLPKAHTLAGARKALRLIGDMGADRFRAAVDHTMANGWQGLREPRETARDRRDEAGSERARAEVSQATDKRREQLATDLRAAAGLSGGARWRSLRGWLLSLAEDRRLAYDVAEAVGATVPEVARAAVEVFDQADKADQETFAQLMRSIEEQLQ